MTYTTKIKKAISFAIDTHEIKQKQKRKGKDIPYILHPLTVGLILSLNGANEDVIIAGILHDTIEDSIETSKITKEIIEEKFGRKVTELVLSVSDNKSLSWEATREENLIHIKDMDKDTLLIKSADILSNISETADDYGLVGDTVFNRFARGKEATMNNYKKLYKALNDIWPENPLLSEISENINRIK